MPGVSPRDYQHKGADAQECCEPGLSSGVTSYLQVSTEAAQAVRDGAPGLSCYRAGSCRFCRTRMIKFHSCSMICMAALYSVRQ